MPAQNTPPPRRPLSIRPVGLADFAGGNAHIHAMILGLSDAGKTRWASAWPRPLFLAAEPGMSSIVRRKIPYAGGLSAPHMMRITSSEEMARVLDEVPVLTRKGAEGLPSYQTFVVDTLDAYSRILKEEFVRDSGEGIFTGRDAWGFLESKMNLLLTRLLNIDAHVLILCHLRDREVKVGTETHTVWEPLLQGQTKDSIFQDFDLVGWMETYWAPGQASGGDGIEKVERRGITFEGTQSRPFLKNRFGITPPGERQLGRKYWPVEMHDGTLGQGDDDTFVQTNFQTIFNAVLDGMDGLEESPDVHTLPDTNAKVAPPAPGGAMPTAPATPAAARPATSRGRSAAVAPAPGAGAAPAPPKVEHGGAVDPGPAVQPAPEPVAVEKVTGEAPGAPAPEAAPAPAPAPEPVVEPVSDEAAVTNVQAAIPADVVEVGPGTAVPNGCALCGKDLAVENQDLVALSKLKHRTLVLPDGRKFYDTPGACEGCYRDLNAQKEGKRGLYAPAA